MGMDMIGRIAFYVGLVVSILAGWMDLHVGWLLVLGLIVGLLNVTAKENSRFLLATLVLVTAGGAIAASLPGALGALGKILVAFIVFTAAAAFIVALKEAYSIQKGK